MGSRRRQINRGEYVHSTLGKNALSDALSKCVQLCVMEIAHRVEFAHDEEWVRHGIFPEPVLKLAHDAYLVVSGSADSYVDYPLGNNVKVRLWWTNVNMIALGEKHTLPNLAGQSAWELYEHSPLQHLVPLMKVRDKVQEIATKWQRARAVINALDQQATLGGFRYYLPAIRQLCQSDVPAEMPTRFIEPLSIGPWMPLIREAQETIATSALLPDNRPAPRPKQIQLHLEMRDEQPTKNSNVNVPHEPWMFRL